MNELEKIKFEQAMSEIRLCVEHGQFHNACRAAQYMALDLEMASSGREFERGQRAREHFVEDYRADREFEELLRLHRVEWAGKWARAFQELRAAGKVAEVVGIEAAA